MSFSNLNPQPLSVSPAHAPCPACGSNEVAIFTPDDARPFGQCEACERAYTMARVLEMPMGRDAIPGSPGVYEPPASLREAMADKPETMREQLERGFEASRDQRRRESMSPADLEVRVETDGERALIEVEQGGESHAHIVERPISYMDILRIVEGG